MFSTRGRVHQEKKGALRTGRRKIRLYTGHIQEKGI